MLGRTGNWGWRYHSGIGPDWVWCFRPETFVGHRTNAFCVRQQTFVDAAHRHVQGATGIRDRRLAHTGTTQSLGSSRNVPIR